MGKRWTKDEDKLLLRLRDEGFSYREIALQLKRTYVATKARASSLTTNKIKRYWTSEDIERLLAMRAEKRSVKEIARRLNRSESAIYQKLNQLE